MFTLRPSLPSTYTLFPYTTLFRSLLMEKELTYLHDELQSPARPFVVILGGAKVSDKIAVINRLIEKADTIIISGGMARSEEHTSELQSRGHLVCRLLLEKKKTHPK